jgi:hypothetical protein
LPPHFFHSILISLLLSPDLHLPFRSPIILNSPFIQLLPEEVTGPFKVHFWFYFLWLVLNPAVPTWDTLPGRWKQ